MVTIVGAVSARGRHGPGETLRLTDTDVSIELIRDKGTKGGGERKREEKEEETSSKHDDSKTTERRVMKLDEEWTSCVPTMFATFTLLESSSGLRFTLHQEGSDAGLASCFVSLSNAEPDATNCEWVACRTGVTQIIECVGEKRFRAGTTFYIAVRHFTPCSSLTSTLTVSDRDTYRWVDGIQEHAFTGDEKENAGEEDTSAPHSGMKKCESCSTWIHGTAFLMHSLRCTSMNKRCTICGIVLPVAHMSKHLEYTHTEYTCVCGVNGAIKEGAAHRRTTCAARLHPCRYCGAYVAKAGLFTHESRCGTKTRKCTECGQRVSMKAFANHLAIFHGMNPCLMSDMSVYYASE